MSFITTDILIIGAGPGGLACAKVLAEQGRQVLVLERQREIGPKVCAGGVARNGLLRLIPEELMERSFPEQYLFTPCQRIVVREKTPVIATVSRKVLGRQMAEQARKAGAEILTGIHVGAVDGLRITAVRQGAIQEIRCSQLVGADGANSLVRRSLGVPAVHRGTGINFQVPGICERMERHMNTRIFGCGHAWIFPHKETVSVGAYSSRTGISSGRLKRNLVRWAANRGFQLGDLYCQTALVNYDYRGYSFGPVWLVGDAAGLASGLSCEGIYPAVVSGETVARQILDPGSKDRALTGLVRKQRQHHFLVKLSRQHPACSFLLMELVLLLLRSRLLPFQAMEMA
jgi:geranylgeranyl reductase